MCRVGVTKTRGFLWVWDVTHERVASALWRVEPSAESADTNALKKLAPFVGEHEWRELLWRTGHSYLKPSIDSLVVQVIHVAAQHPSRLERYALCLGSNVSIKLLCRREEVLAECAVKYSTLCFWYSVTCCGRTTNSVNQSALVLSSSDALLQKLVSHCNIVHEAASSRCNLLALVERFGKSILLNVGKYVTTPTRERARNYIAGVDTCRKPRKVKRLSCFSGTERSAGCKTDVLPTLTL